MPVPQLTIASAFLGFPRPRAIAPPPISSPSPPLANVLRVTPDCKARLVPSGVKERGRMYHIQAAITIARAVRILNKSDSIGGLGATTNVTNNVPKLIIRKQVSDFKGF